MLFEADRLPATSLPLRFSDAANAFTVVEIVCMDKPKVLTDPLVEILIV